MINFTSIISRLNLLKQIPIFANLNWFELQKIARKSLITEHKKGDLISREGNPPDFFYCLISGRVQAYTTAVDGKKENVDFIHRGMYFGVISVLTEENHSMSFEAINNSIVLKIPVVEFRAILKTIPALSMELSEHLSRRIRRNVKGAESVFESTVISVYSPVKGAGSSTYAANLALSLQRETRKRVIYVHIYSSSIVETPALSERDEHPAPQWRNSAIELSQIVGDHEKIYQHVVKGELKIDLLNVVFSENDSALKDEIGAFVSAFVGDYHYVVVDLPTKMDDVVFEALTQSDLVHLIATDDAKDMDSVRHILDGLEKKLKERFKEDRIRIIVRALMAPRHLSLEMMNKQIDYHIDSILPALAPGQWTQNIDTRSIRIVCSDHKTPYARAVTHIARQIGGVSIGLALGGGAALGLAHIGVLKVLEEEDVPIDMIAGSSMGALIGSLWAVGKSSEEIQQIAREFRPHFSKIKLIDPPIFPVSGLIRGQTIRRWMARHFGGRTFYDVRVPVKVVANDLARREEIVIENGLLAEAVYRSTAIPGVIPPIQDQDQMIIDGGILNPLPTNVLASRGIKKIIAVNVLQSPRDASDGFDMTREQWNTESKIAFVKNPWLFVKFRVYNALFKIFNPNISDIIIQTLQASEYVISEQSAQQADVVIHPSLVGVKWYQLDRIDELVKRGEDAARASLPEIRKLIEGERPPVL